MFDLDAIEKDWKENSFCLSNKEIREIYIAEGVTTKAYDETMTKFRNSLPKYYENEIAAKEGLLKAIFMFKEELKEETERLKKITEERQKRLKDKPKRPYLSHKAQIKVVEGSMDVVFKLVKIWHNSYEKLSLEDLYYVALEGLFAAAKYCLHYTTKDSFRAYASSCIEKQIISYIAKKEHITYRNAYCIAFGCFNDWDTHAEENKAKYSIRDFSFKHNKEIPCNPSCISEMLKDKNYQVDYTGEVSSEEFMKDYKKALQELPEDEFSVMRLSYDNDGNPGLTANEISKILGMNESKIYSLKRRAKKALNSDQRFNKYRKLK